MIKSSLINTMNIQLKSVNVLLNDINDDINKNIHLFYNIMNNNIDVYINKEKVNVIKDNNDWKYNFKKEGKYKFKIIFNDNN